MKLLLKNYEHDESLTLVEFIYLFLTNFNRKLHTVYETGAVQCGRASHRSLGDITAICQSYYPKATQEQVKEILLNFGHNLVGHYCGDIEARVYEHKHEFSGFEQMSEGEKDEFGDPIYYLSEDRNESQIRKSIPYRETD